MRVLSIIAIAVGIFALAGAAFAYGPGMGGGWGGGWGGHMMAPGYHMNGAWGGHMGQAWGDGTDDSYVGPYARNDYGPGYGLCYADPGAAPVWNAPQNPEPAPGIDR